MTVKTTGDHVGEKSNGIPLNLTVVCLWLWLTSYSPPGGLAIASLPQTKETALLIRTARFRSGGYVVVSNGGWAVGIDEISIVLT
jgi:hypothetical protein